MSLKKEKKKTLITPELRPYVRGTYVKYEKNNNIKKKRRLIISHTNIDLIIFSSREDSTGEYYTKYAMENGKSTLHLKVEDKSELIACIQYVYEQINKAEKPIPIYFRGSGYSEDEEYSMMIETLYDLLYFYPGNMIGRPSRKSLNGSKPNQLTSVNSTNLIQLPNTILIKSKFDLPKLLPDRVIMKSISAVRSKVVECDKNNLLNSSNNLACPYLVQQLLLGHHIRVHVIDNWTYACELISDEIDYRYALKQVKVWNLDKEVALWCRHLVREEGLDFGGVDFVYDPDIHTYFFLELNPTPSYHFYETNLVEQGFSPDVSSEILYKLFL